MVVLCSPWLYPPPKVQPNFYVTKRILKLRLTPGKSTEVTGNYRMKLWLSRRRALDSERRKGLICRLPR